VAQKKKKKLFYRLVTPQKNKKNKNERLWEGNRGQEFPDPGGGKNNGAHQVQKETGGNFKKQVVVVDGALQGLGKRNNASTR